MFLPLTDTSLSLGWALFKNMLFTLQQIGQDSFQNYLFPDIHRQSVMSQFTYVLSLVLIDNPHW